VLVSETLAWASRRLQQAGRDLAVRKQTEEALRTLARERAEQAHAAEQLARLQQEFVMAASHELRTPLTSVLGYAEFLQLRWERLDEQGRRERLDSITAAALRLRTLVDDMLQVSRLESNAPAVRSEPMPLTAVASHAAEVVKGSYNGQIVEVRGQAGVSALGDAARTEQILINLIDNAAKYSPEGSPVEVTWTVHPGRVAVRVVDHGPGIPANGREMLFTRFGRVPGSMVRAGRVGTGLGLYLGRAYAEAMGGTLDLESTGPEGSTFCLCLPLAGVNRPPVPASNTLRAVSAERASRAEPALD
jgi:signal transduction histidine kinase